MLVVAAASAARLPAIATLHVLARLLVGAAPTHGHLSSLNPRFDRFRLALGPDHPIGHHYRRCWLVVPACLPAPHKRHHRWLLPGSSLCTRACSELQGLIGVAVCTSCRYRIGGNWSAPLRPPRMHDRARSFTNGDVEVVLRAVEAAAGAGVVAEAVSSATDPSTHAVPAQHHASGGSPTRYPATGAHSAAEPCLGGVVDGTGASGGVGEAGELRRRLSRLASMVPTLQAKEPVPPPISVPPAVMRRQSSSSSRWSWSEPDTPTAHTALQVDCTRRDSERHDAFSAAQPNRVRPPSTPTSASRRRRPGECIVISEILESNTRHLISVANVSDFVMSNELGACRCCGSHLA